MVAALFGPSINNCGYCGQNWVMMFKKKIETADVQGALPYSLTWQERPAIVASLFFETVTDGESTTFPTYDAVVGALSGGLSTVWLTRQTMREQIRGDSWAMAED
jgi:hypothetical protein